MSGGEDLLSAGRACCAGGRFDEAIRVFRELVRADPARPDAYRWLVSSMVAWARQRGLTGPPTSVPTRALPRLSVVVCSNNPTKLAGLESNLRSLVPGDALELIAITDARSMCEGYNRGARRAGAEHLLFCHDDIRIHSPAFAWTLAERLRDFDLVGIAGAARVIDGHWVSAGIPHLAGQVLHRLADRAGVTYSLYGVGGAVRTGIHALDGLLLGVRRETWQSFRFDADHYGGFHLYDLDFSYRCHLGGARLAVCTDLLVEHHSLGRYDATWRRWAGVFAARFADRLPEAAPGPQVVTNFRLAGMDDAWALHHALQAFGDGHTPVGGG